MEDTIKNFTDNNNGGISTSAEDSSTSPSLLPSSTTILQNDNDDKILTSTITNGNQSTPDNNINQLDTHIEGEHVLNKTAKNTNETSLANVMKSKQQQEQQEPQGNEQKTEDIRVITTLINTPDQLTGKAKVTVTFIEEDENNQITFQSNNKTITAEEEIVFPLTLVKAVNEEEEEQPSTMNVCAVVEGFENTCDTVLLVQNQTKPYKINLELINFEEVEPLS